MRAEHVVGCFLPDVVLCVVALQVCTGEAVDV